MAFVPPKPIGTDMTDSGVTVGDPCNLWATVDNQRLLSTVHQSMSDAYAPITAEADRGGNANRYTTARKLMFTEVERYQSADGPFVVECIYTGQTTPAPQTEDPNRDFINCEHVWPRSRMVDEDVEPTLYSHQQSDIHNLMPSNPDANSARGNLPFGEVTADRTLDYMPSVVGMNSRGDRVWEPRRERRGDVARIMFYMSVRWGLDIDPEQEAILRRWNATDPPDTREAIRNQNAAMIQGNRNPFVDCPSLADRIPDFFAFDSLDTDRSLPQP